MLVLYSTYAMFSKDLDIGNLVNLTMSSLPTDSSIQEYERITIEAGDMKTIDLNITNSTSDSLYYGVWYEMVEPTSINENIIIAKLDESANPIIGQLTSNETKKVTLYLENSTSEDIIVNIGVGYSNTNSLNLSTGKTIITAEASQAIDGDALPKPFVKNFTYQNSVQTYSIPNTGSYKLEVWGAQGESYNTTYAGGNGYSSSTTYLCSAGGGSSDIRIGTDTLYYRVIVAGGGTSGVTGSQYSTSYRAGIGGS